MKRRTMRGSSPSFSPGPRRDTPPESGSCRRLRSGIGLGLALALVGIAMPARADEPAQSGVPAAAEPIAKAAANETPVQTTALVNTAQPVNAAAPPVNVAAPVI